MNRIGEFVKRNKSLLLYIILLFIVSRLVLSMIGAISFNYFRTSTSSPSWRKELIGEHPRLATWAVWDSQWYLQIAQEGYADAVPFVKQRYSSIGFFPLYPLLVAGVSIFVRDYLIAGIIVSNAFFLFSAFLLYKLMQLEYNDSVAKRSLWYLFLFPTAYIFSAVYAESLMLFLSLACFYAAQKERWGYAGIAGFFLALTKSAGFLITIPLIWIYLSKKNFSWKMIRPNILFASLIPLGLATFGFYNYIVTGDMLAYSHVQQAAWNHYFTNPIPVLVNSIFKNNFDALVNGLGLALSIAFVIIGFKKIPFAYWLYALLLMLFIPSTGLVAGSLRYLSVIFPIIMLLAVYSESEKVDRGLTMSLALFQGCLFVFWTVGYVFMT